jgi:hypothetical protein
MEAFYSQITMDQTLGTTYFGGPQNLILYLFFLRFHTLPLMSKINSCVKFGTNNEELHEFCVI